MATTFAYEFYKRNHFSLVIGLKPVDGKSKFIPKVENGSIVYEKDKSDDENSIFNIITGLYDVRPNVAFSTSFEPASNELVDIITDVRKFYSKLKTAYKSVDGNGAFDKLANVGGALFEAITGDAAKFGKMMQEMLNSPTESYMSPHIAQWQGNGPVTFSVKFIFISEDGGPVYFDKKIKTLLSAVGSMGPTDTIASMKGPLGYNSNVFGSNAVNAILRRDLSDTYKDLVLSLHSLTLYRGQETILDLRNLLVITKVDIKTSEQLYISTPEANEPAYKWITADVTFMTACPIPAPLANTHTTMSSFYGINQEAGKAGSASPPQPAEKLNTDHTNSEQSRQKVSGVDPNPGPINFSRPETPPIQ
jgi:hypothetical protein